MARNLYSPPAARVDVEPASRALRSVLLSLLGGVACWQLAIKTSGWAFPNLWRPLADAGYSMPAALRIVTPFVVMAAAFSSLMALMHPRIWGSLWAAFLAGLA